MSVIFLHIPKSAGTSVRIALENSSAKERLIRLYHNQIGIDIEEAKAKISDDAIIYGHVQFGIHETFGIKPNYAAILRHPVDRLVSLYKHIARDPELELGKKFRGGVTLEKALNQKTSPEFFNDMTYILSGMASARKGDEKAFYRAKNNIDQFFSFVGIRGQITGKLRELQTLFNVPDLEIGRYNVGTGPEINLDQKLTNLIVNLNSLDMMLFNYVRSLGEK